MRLLALCLTAMLSLGACGLSTSAPASAAITDQFPTQLPATVTVDEKLGVAVETAYQAATLAVRTAVKAGFVNPSQARSLALLDTQAYTYLCYTRTAYDVANGQSAAARVDGCPVATKTGRIPSYVDSARAALVVVKEMVGSLRSYQQAG